MKTILDLTFEEITSLMNAKERAQYNEKAMQIAMETLVVPGLADVLDKMPEEFVDTLANKLAGKQRTAFNKLVASSAIDSIQEAISVNVKRGIRTALLSTDGRYNGAYITVKMGDDGLLHVDSVSLRNFKKKQEQVVA